MAQTTPSQKLLSSIVESEGEYGIMKGTDFFVLTNFVLKVEGVANDAETKG